MDLPWLQPGCPVTMLSEQPGCHSPTRFCYLFVFNHYCCHYSCYDSLWSLFFKWGFSKYFLNSTCLHQGRSPCVPAGMLPQELAVLLKRLITNNHNNNLTLSSQKKEHFWKIIIWWIFSPRARRQMELSLRWCGWCPQMLRTHGWKIIDMLSCWSWKACQLFCATPDCVVVEVWVGVQHYAREPPWASRVKSFTWILIDLSNSKSIVDGESFLIS